MHWLKFNAACRTLHPLSKQRGVNICHFLISVLPLAHFILFPNKWEGTVAFIQFQCFQSHSLFAVQTKGSVHLPWFHFSASCCTLYPLSKQRGVNNSILNLKVTAYFFPWSCFCFCFTLRCHLIHFFLTIMDYFGWLLKVVGYNLLLHTYDPVCKMGGINWALIMTFFH